MSASTNKQPLPHDYDAVPTGLDRVVYFCNGSSSGCGIFLLQPSGQYLIYRAYLYGGAANEPVLPGIRFRLATLEEYAYQLPYGEADILDWPGRVIYFSDGHHSGYGVFLPSPTGRQYLVYEAIQSGQGGIVRPVSPAIRFRNAHPEELQGREIFSHPELTFEVLQQRWQARHMKVDCTHSSVAANDQAVFAVTVYRGDDGVLSFSGSAWRRLDETIGSQFRLQIEQSLGQEHANDTLPFAMLTSLPFSTTANVLVYVVKPTDDRAELYDLLDAANKRGIPIIELVPPDEEQARQTFATNLKWAINLLCGATEHFGQPRWLIQINLICRTEGEAAALDFMLFPPPRQQEVSAP